MTYTVPAPRTVVTQVHFVNGRRGRRCLEAGPSVPDPKEHITGRVPRVSRLMALAIRFDQLLKEGSVASQADLAELGHVTRARVTQILNLLHLAPDIQDALLHLPLTETGRDRLSERHLRPLVQLVAWDDQRRRWHRLAARTA